MPAVVDPGDCNDVLVLDPGDCKLLGLFDDEDGNVVVVPEPVI